MNALRRMIVTAHRRSLWQVFTVYVAVSWGVYQVISALPALIGIPEWVPGIAVVLFLIGLPIVLATAFVQEGVSRPSSRVEEDPTLMPGFTTNSISEPALGASPARHVLTWRRSIGAGVAAFVALIVLTGGYVGTRALGIGPAASLVGRGDLNEGDVILLADFTGPPSDAALGHTVTETLRVELARSDAIHLADPADVRAALHRMRIDSTKPLDASTATQAALRQNWKGVITGEANAAGNGLILTARILNTQGETLASFRESAADADAVIPAIDKLARSIRSRVGESLRTVNASQPLEEVTTASLPALRKYSEAVAESNTTKGIALLEESVAIDSTFAMAWRKLGAWYFNAGRHGDALRAYRAAYANREHLSELERAVLEADYYRQVERDSERSIRRYSEALAIDSLQPAALNNLAETYGSLGRYAEAREIGLRGMRTRMRRPFGTAIAELADAQFALKDDTGFVTTASIARPNQKYMLQVSAAVLRHDYRRLDSLIAHPDTGVAAGPKSSARTLSFRLRGQLDSMRAATQAVVKRGNRGTALEFNNAASRLHIGEDASAEIAALAAWLDGTPMTSEAADGWWNLATLYAMSGDAPRARAAVKKAEQRVAASGAPAPETWVQLTQAAIALAERKTEVALATLREPVYAQCRDCFAFFKAQAFDAAAQRDSAIAYFEQAVHPKVISTAAYSAMTQGISMFRLAQLYEEAGNIQKAVEYYGRVAEMWKTGDGAARAKRAQALARILALQQRRG
jgi:eukaryotic-like serine/threonine-protein kinase